MPLFAVSGGNAHRSAATFPAFDAWKRMSEKEQDARLARMALSGAMGAEPTIRA